MNDLACSTEGNTQGVSSEFTQPVNLTVLSQELYNLSKTSQIFLVLVFLSVK